MQSPKLETYLSDRAFQFQLKSLEKYYKRYKIAFGEEEKTYQLHEYRDLGFFLFFLFLQQVIISGQFYTHQCIHVNPNLQIHPTTTSTPRHFPPLVSICLFSTSMSQFLPCKLVHLYHFSRFHIYALIYDICFSLSDLLHSV